MHDTMSSTDMNYFENTYSKAYNAIANGDTLLSGIEDEYKTYEVVSLAIDQEPLNIFDLNEDLLKDKEINNLAETAYQADSDIIIEMFYDKLIKLTKVGKYLKQYMQKFLSKLRNLELRLKIIYLDLIRSDGSLPLRLELALGTLYDLEKKLII